MINILTDLASGGTFLTWTLHYLAGHTRYYLVENESWLPITDNPLTSNNSHQFIPNQPNRLPNCSTDHFKNIARKLNQTPTDTFHTLYFHPFTIKETTDLSLKYINDNHKKLIVVDTSDHTLYHCSYRKRSPVYNGCEIINNNKDIQDYLIDVYFSKSKSQWDNLNLTETWDLREFIALNFRPFEFDHVYKHVDRTQDHVVIKGSELWTLFDYTLKKVFDYCEISIDQSRLDRWQEIYKIWKTNHCQRLLFSNYFETIVDSILNNYSLDLKTFDLDIEQEAAIQHALIYRHNLNLKTWQLEKFVNTQQLHNLLEPNIHPLSS